MNPSSNAGPSPLAQEDIAYREKIRQLSKYIDPLRKMIARIGNEGNNDTKLNVLCIYKLYTNILRLLLIEICFIVSTKDVEKLSKMKKLLEILSNPTQRMPLETLLKCEIALEKLDLSRVNNFNSFLKMYCTITV